jgi:light-regulated signal transduction histidine kinase (bacteriophytochrome)
LVFQKEEKEKRANELTIANRELVIQNEEKEKRAAELARANIELMFQSREKEKRAEELVIANKELQQFAYIASHDLQEPLRTVSNYMEVFAEEYLGQLDDNARAYLQSVNNATKRMSILINSLLDFSRLGKNRNLAYVDIQNVINDVLEDINSKVRTSNAVIKVAPMPKLYIYESELRQVFQNLLTNAIKFQKKGSQPKIEISAQEENEKWKFTVKDNGIGIAPIHFNRIFDMFQRLFSREKYEGMGIGLSNCKKLVNLHNGEIWVESVPEEGAAFHFTIASMVPTEGQ